MSDNFQQAASRHWRDANVLYHEGAYENADQLLGLAAECAIKYALGMSGRVHKNVHIDELWDKVTPNYVSRQFATLAVILQQFRPNPWSNWSIEQRYFADGLAEDIITRLSRLRWLFVTARNSSFTYQAQVADVKLVGRELGVRYVLGGSVRRSGQRLRIGAQLIDAATGTQVWADHYDTEMADFLTVQDKISENVMAPSCMPKPRTSRKKFVTCRYSEAASYRAHANLPGGEPNIFPLLGSSGCEPVAPIPSVGRAVNPPGGWG